MKALISLQDYMKQEDISRQAVYKRINNGTIESVKLKNKTYLVTNGLQGSLPEATQTPITKEIEVIKEVEVEKIVYEDSKETLKELEKQKEMANSFGLYTIFGVVVSVVLSIMLFIKW